MKRLLGLCLIVASGSAAADGFTCEKIKDKTVRAECVKDRIDAAKKKQDDDAADAASREVAASKRADLDSFVAKAKSLLIQNFKDPQSAQFQGLKVAETKVDRALCGSVNAKNSYGGYVGFKKFFVVFWTDPRIKLPPEVWTEGGEAPAKLNAPTPEVARLAAKYEESEQRMHALRCAPSESVVITPAS